MSSLHKDIRNGDAIKQLFETHKPEIVFHLAAQPLVRYSYRKPVETYETNVMGTLHVLEAIRSVGTVRAGIMITTDKCYKNNEWIWGYRENEPMGGHDPYSSSKGAAELLISSYRDSYFPPALHKQHKTAIASVRAGNVIGGGDWAEDRIIPDIIRAFQNNQKIVIRNPNAIRPWQHVLEPLSGYIQLAERLSDADTGSRYAEAWNFGPKEENAKPVQWIVEQMSQYWGQNSGWIIDDNDSVHEASYLKLDSSKACERLDWQPKWNLSQTLKTIVEWHQLGNTTGDYRNICLTHIQKYIRDI